MRGRVGGLVGLGVVLVADGVAAGAGLLPLDVAVRLGCAGVGLLGVVWLLEAGHRVAAPASPSFFAREEVTRTERPRRLAQLERLVLLASRSASDLHRLRPVVRDSAFALLRSSGRDLRRAPQLLGPAWELVRPDARPPDDPRGPGFSVEELAGVVTALEEL